MTTTTDPKPIPLGRTLAAAEDPYRLRLARVQRKRRDRAQAVTEAQERLVRRS